MGTYWHRHDPRTLGFTPHHPGMVATLNRLMVHVAQGTTTSPFVSFTRSFGIARDYSLAGTSKPSAKNPAFVWEVELENPLPTGVALLDPVLELAKDLPEPLSPIPYQHDGPQAFLLGVVDPSIGTHLIDPSPSPPGATSSLPKPPTLTRQLQTLVFALRDAEVLSVGTVPGSCVRARYEIY